MVKLSIFLLKSQLEPGTQTLHSMLSNFVAHLQINPLHMCQKTNAHQVVNMKRSIYISESHKDVFQNAMLN